MTRKEAIKRLESIVIRDALQEDYDALDMAIEALERKPKKGHWIKYQEPWGGTQKWKCSNCGNHYDINRVYTIMPYNYCPNCGAKMKEGE